MLGDGTSTLAVEDLAKFMINISDNTAANMVIDEVGMENVNKLIVSLGFKEMKLRRHMMDSPAQARGDDNTATPAEGAEIMARISRCELPLSKDSAEKLADPGDSAGAASFEETRFRVRFRLLSSGAATREFQPVGDCESTRQTVCDVHYDDVCG